MRWCALLKAVVIPAVLHAGVDTAWVRRYDGPAHGADGATKISVDSVGNVYVAGYSDGVGTGGDFVTIKYSPTGDTLWTQRQDFSAHDKPTGLAVDSQGNVYVSGTTDVGMATVKYSSSGVRRWYKLFGSDGFASDLALDSDGNVFVCGSSYRASLDEVTIKYRPNGDTAWVRYFDYAGDEDYAWALAVGQNGDVAVTGWGAGTATHYDCTTVLYDSTGNQLWASGYDGPNHGDDRTYDVAVDGSGNVVAVGNGDNGYTTPYDYLTIKYSPTGETLWTRRYDGTTGGSDEAYAIAIDDSGNSYVTGESQQSSSSYAYTTIAYSPDGVPRWSASYYGPGQDGSARAVATDPYGNVYVTGLYYFDATARDDYLTIRYGPEGDTVWTRRYNGPASGYDMAYCIAADDDGGVYVAGKSQGGGTDFDIAVVKYEQTGGAFEPKTTVVVPSALRASPNPLCKRAEIAFTLLRTGTLTLRVYDVAGRRIGTVLDGRVMAGAHTVVWYGTDDSGSRVPAGIYSIVLDGAGVILRTTVTVLE